MGKNVEPNKGCSSKSCLIARGYPPCQAILFPAAFTLPQATVKCIGSFHRSQTGGIILLYTTTTTTNNNNNNTSQSKFFTTCNPGNADPAKDLRLGFDISNKSGSYTPGSIRPSSHLPDFRSIIV